MNCSTLIPIFLRAEHRNVPPAPRDAGRAT
jgi:hypothetical protein